MTGKEQFIKWVEIKLENETVNDEILAYFEKLKAEKEKSAFTEKGANILKYMQTTADEVDNLFTAKSIGEGMNCAAKTIAGSMRKLVTDGYVNKEKGDASLVYNLTEKGKSALV